MSNSQVVLQTRQKVEARLSKPDERKQIKSHQKYLKLIIIDAIAVENTSKNTN